MGTMKYRSRSLHYVVELVFTALNKCGDIYAVYRDDDGTPHILHVDEFHHQFDIVEEPVELHVNADAHAGLREAIAELGGRIAMLEEKLWDEVRGKANALSD
jgi:hypothetical protein